MQIHQLRYFIAVAEELHFGKAAKKLNISQPPLSQQIKKLEESLGTELFYRTKRQVHLTKAGKLFLEEAYKIVDQIESTYERIHRYSNGEIGEITLGYSSYSIFDVLPKILKEFYRLYPNVNVKLKHLSTAKQMEAFENSEIQIGLLCPPIDRRNLVLEIIYSQPFIVALPSNHQLVEKKMNKESINIKDLANSSFIMTPREIGAGYYDSIIKLCLDGNFSPKIVQEVNELHEIISLVSTGLGVSIVPESLMQFKKTNVIFKKLNNNKYYVDTALVYRKNESSKIVYNFINTARDVLRPHVSSIRVEDLKTSSEI